MLILNKNQTLPCLLFILKRGDEGEIEVAAPELESRIAGERHVKRTFAFDHAGRYVVKVDFIESPGREVLSFPLLVTERDRSASTRKRGFVLAGLVVLVLLAMARAAAIRSRRKRSAPADME